MGIDLIEQTRGEALSGFAESLLADGPHAHGRAVDLGEQAIQLGLHTGTHAPDHHGGDARQGEDSLASEGRWMQSDALGQGRCVKECPETGPDGGGSRYLSSYYQ